MAVANHITPKKLKEIGFDHWGLISVYFDYEKYYHKLPIYCPDALPIWFNSDKYNYEKYSDVLAEHCPQHFHIWFKKDKFNYKKASYALAQYCSQYFKDWYDPSLYNWEVHFIEIMLFCKDYITDWWSEDGLAKYASPEVIEVIGQHLWECGLIPR